MHYIRLYFKHLKTIFKLTKIQRKLIETIDAHYNFVNSKDHMVVNLPIKSQINCLIQVNFSREHIKQRLISRLATGTNGTPGTCQIKHIVYNYI